MAGWMSQTTRTNRSACDGASYLSRHFARDGGNERNRGGLREVCFARQIKESGDRLFNSVQERRPRQIVDVNSDYTHDPQGEAAETPHGEPVIPRASEILLSGWPKVNSLG